MTNEPSKRASAILIIDDDESLLDIASEFLCEAGYKVYTAGSGEEGLTLWSQHSHEIGLVISDMGLPGIGGGEVLENVQRNNPSVKTVAMSGFSGDDMLEQVRSSRVHSFMPKPFSRDDLLKVVNSFIGPP